MTTQITTSTFFPVSATPEDEVFGLYFGEVIAPAVKSETPVLRDWELRLWPVARFGDATFEARPRRPDLSPQDLSEALGRCGWRVCGPVRRKRS